MNQSAKACAVLLISLAAIGCREKKGTSTPKVRLKAGIEAREAQKKLIDAFAYDGPTFLKDRHIGALRKLGKILSESKKRVPDPYSENTEVDHFTFNFEGLILEGVQWEEELTLTGVEIFSPTWPMKNGLNIGCDPSSLLKVLGKPISEKNGVWLYEGETEVIQFVVDRGKVKKIMIGYYTG